MLTEAFPSVMCLEPLATPYGSPEDVRGDLGHSPTDPLPHPTQQQLGPCPARTWKYWFSCTRLSLDRILLMVIRLLLIPPKPVGIRGQGTV